MRQIFVHLQSKSCCWSKSALFQVHVKRAFSTGWGQVGAAGEGRTIPPLLGCELTGIANNADTDPFPQTLPVQVCPSPGPFFETKVLKEETPTKAQTTPGSGWVELAQVCPASSLWAQGWAG